MEKLIGEYMEMLGGEGLASEKFWALEKRVNEDKRRSGVLIERMSRSTMHREIALLARDGAIAPRDLEGLDYGFSTTKVIRCNDGYDIPTL